MDDGCAEGFVGVEDGLVLGPDGFVVGFAVGVLGILDG